jgi:tetratricopeptide (TPR) repeat protein
MKRSAVLAVFLALYTGSVGATKANDTLYMGLGAQTCVQFNNDYRIATEEVGFAYLAWAHGYLSGINYQLMQPYDKRFVNLDLISIKDEWQLIRNYCTEHPFENYYDAVRDVYKRVLKANIKQLINQALAQEEESDEHPSFAAAYQNRALAYTNKGDFQHAVADVNKAVELGQKLEPAPAATAAMSTPVKVTAIEAPSSPAQASSVAGGRQQPLNSTPAKIVRPITARVPTARRTADRGPIGYDVAGCAHYWLVGGRVGEICRHALIRSSTAAR